MLILILALLLAEIFMCGIIFAGQQKISSKQDCLKYRIDALSDLMAPQNRTADDKPAEPAPHLDEIQAALKRAAEYEIKLNEGITNIMNYDIHQARAAVGRARRGGAENA